MIQPIMKVKAYLRLQKIKEKSNELDTFSNDVVKALCKYNELEQAVILKKVTSKIKNRVEHKKVLQERDFLRTERANDILRLV